MSVEPISFTQEPRSISRTVAALTENTKNTRKRKNPEKTTKLQNPAEGDASPNKKHQRSSISSRFLNRLHTALSAGQPLTAPPIVGPRPVFEFSLEFFKKKHTVRALVDTGCAMPTISYECVKRLRIPRVKRDVPVALHAFNGEPVAGTGQAHTQVLGLRYRNHYEKLSFEIVPSLGDGMDIFLPSWWVQVHRPSDLYTDELRFESEFCRRNCCGDVESRQEDDLSKFEIVWDEDVAKDPDALHIGALNRANSDVCVIAERLPARYHSFLDLFDDREAASLPKHTSYDHAIDLLPGETAPWGPMYNLSARELQVLREYLDTMLKSGRIRPSKSPAGAPILFAPKKNGKLRLCVDYRGLNKVTVKNRYPLPLMTELRDRVAGANWFTKIDLRNGYHLIRIKEGDEWKTAFRTRYGHFEYLVMPFGLANAPASFQAMMNDVLRDLLDQGVVCYIDDILIYSETEAEHERLVTEVLRRLKEHNLFCAIDKSVFHVHEVEFLGYMVGAEGISMADDKVQCIKEWEPPQSVKDVQSFIGFANFYRRFIKGFAKICKPMTDLTKKGPGTFRWNEAAQEAFEELKRRFISAPILKHFDPELQTVLETDASDFAIGAVLSQYHGSTLHPVAFFSKKLNAAERNYDVHDKELLAIVASFDEWRQYCEGSKFPVRVYTDHKNLEYFLTTKVLNQRQARWSEKLSAYNYNIMYRPGSKNGKADGLSRRSELRPERGGEAKVATTEMFRPGVFLSDSGTDGEVFMSGSYVAALTARAIQFSVTFLDRVRECSRADGTYVDILKRVKDGHSGKKDPLKDFAIEGGLLYYKKRLYIPDNNELRLEVAIDSHDSRVAGHFGQEKTLELMTRNFYWPELDKWINEYVRSCDICQRNKSPRHKKFGLLQPLELPSSPWQSIAMDFIVELPESEGNTSIWAIVDRFTKMAHFIAIPGKTNAPDLARIFVKEIWCHGHILDRIYLCVVAVFVWLCSLLYELCFIGRKGMSHCSCVAILLCSSGFHL